MLEGDVTDSSGTLRAELLKEGCCCVNRGKIWKPKEIGETPAQNRKQLAITPFSLHVWGPACLKFTVFVSIQTVKWQVSFIEE